MNKNFKKIAILYFFFRKGGAERVIINTANYLSENFKVKVVTFRCENEEIKNITDFDFINFNIPLKFLDLKINLLNFLSKILTKIIFQLKGAKMLKKFLKNYQPDVVFCISLWDIFWTARAVRKDKLLNKIKIVMWWHNSIEAYKRHPFWYFRNLYFSVVSTHVVLNESMKNEIQKLFPGKEVYVLYNSLDCLDNFFISRGKNFLYIGRLNNKQKRIDRLFYALAQLTEYEWQLIIIGDGEDKLFLQNLAKRLKIDQRIEWLGWLEKPWELIRDINFGILTSDFEGFSLAVAEGIYHGVPYISMDCPFGPRDIIQEGVNGVLVPLERDEKRNTQNLTEALRKALENKIKLETQEKMRESVQKFHPLEIKKKWEIFLNNLLINYENSDAK